MAECERLSTCSFFAGDMEQLPAMSGIYKDKYCRGTYEDCARIKLLSFLEEKRYDISDKLEKEIEKVSPTLSPNDIETVNILLGL